MSFKLRPMTMDDAERMLVWKNDSMTRKFAIVSKNIIRKENHYKWLQKNLRYFNIIEEGTVILGAIRMQNNEISIWLGRLFWGRGIASAIIKRVSKTGMTCKIVEGNIASMRAFINAGFKPIKHINNYYIFQK